MENNKIVAIIEYRSFNGASRETELVFDASAKNSDISEAISYEISYLPKEDYRELKNVFEILEDSSNIETDRTRRIFTASCQRAEVLMQFSDYDQDDIHDLTGNSDRWS